MIEDTSIEWSPDVVDTKTQDFFWQHGQNLNVLNGNLNGNLNDHTTRAHNYVLDRDSGGGPGSGSCVQVQLEGGKNGHCYHSVSDSHGPMSHHEVENSYNHHRYQNHHCDAHAVSESTEIDSSAVHMSPTKRHKSDMHSPAPHSPQPQPRPQRHTAVRLSSASGSTTSSTSAHAQFEHNCHSCDGKSGNLNLTVNLNSKPMEMKCAVNKPHGHGRSLNTHCQWQYDQPTTDAQSTRYYRDDYTRDHTMIHHGQLHAVAHTTSAPQCEQFQHTLTCTPAPTPTPPHADTAQLEASISMGFQNKCTCMSAPTSLVSSPSTSTTSSPASVHRVPIMIPLSTWMTIVTL